MKICRCCNEQKDEVEFSANSSRQDGLQLYCKACSKVKHQTWYQKNKTKVIAKAQEWNETHKEQVRQNKQARNLRVKEYYVEELGGKCMRCGYCEFLGALQFHHLDPEAKDFSIKNGTVKAQVLVEKELEKCILLCTNCHTAWHNGEWSYKELKWD